MNANLIDNIAATAARIHFRTWNVAVLEVASEGRKWLYSLGCDLGEDPDVTEGFILSEYHRILREVESYAL
jgi:hypothetical protein